MVKIDIVEGLYESLDIVIGDLMYTQQLDCMNLSFKRIWCQYGHLVQYCHQPFRKYIWSYVSGNLAPPPSGVSTMFPYWNSEGRLECILVCMKHISHVENVFHTNWNMFQLLYNAFPTGICQIFPWFNCWDRCFWFCLLIRG